MTKTSKFFEPLAVAVAGGNSIKAAADVASCSVQTAYNTSATVEFKSRVSELRTVMTDQAVGELSAAAAEAVTTLRELLGKEFDPSQRITAAKAILAAVQPMSELAELRRRLDSLEQPPTALKVAQ